MRVRDRVKTTTDEGAVAVVTALLLTVLLLFAAFVIDLGALRADRSQGQLVADMAAAAAGQSYSANEPGTAREGCLDAIAYAEQNLGVSLEPDGAGCEVFPDASSGELCDSSWSPAVYTGGAYTVTVTIPVDDNDDLLRGDNYAEVDGFACQRVGVEVTRSRDYFIAGAVGAGDGGSTATGAVARAGGPGDLGEFASLIVLHEQHCQALRAGGSDGAKVVVERNVADDGTVYPGIITVDSLDHGCENQNNRIIRTAGGGILEAADHIFSHQLQVDPANNPNVVYNPSHNITPTPEPGRRITRAPVDHLYNCRASYPAGQRWSPNHADSVSPGSPCEEAGEIPPYITALHGAYQGLEPSDVPTDWGLIDSDQCNDLDGTFGPGAGDSESHWFIDCDGTTGNTRFRPENAHFDGVEAVVINGPVELQDNLQVTGHANHSAVFYLQQGSFEAGAQAELVLEDTFVYVHAGSVDVAAGADVIWEAPLEGEGSTSCDAYDNDYDFSGGDNPAPPADCFAPLTLWTNLQDGDHRLGGGGQVRTVGSFFTPNAVPFRLRGGSGNDYTDSQFFAGLLDVGGGGTITMVPNPETNIELPLLGPSLIR